MLTDVAVELAITESQAYALVRSGDLPAIKVGGRGQWRVERDRLEKFIARLYDDTAEFVREHPYPTERGSLGGPDCGGDAGRRPPQQHVQPGQ